MHTDTLKNDGANFLLILRKPFNTKNNYKQAVEFILSNMSDASIQACDEEYRENLIVMRRNIEKIHDRAEQDVIKLLQIFHSRKFLELKDCLTSPGSVELVFPSAPAEKEKDYHAEMNIADHILTRKIESRIYIGISKLSCFGCYLDFMVIMEDEVSERIEFRGTHAVEYASRMETRWGKSAIAKFKDCIGMTREENKDMLFAELSDSDEESESDLIGAPSVEPG